jgi:hypothetical protein
MAIGAVVARIVSQYSDKGSKAAQRDIAKLGKNFDAFAKKAGKAFAVASAASAAFAVKVGVDAVKAATEDQKSQVLLANSLRNTVGATDAAISSVEDYITKQQKLFSVADDQLRPSLAALAAVTGSITEAQKLQSVALDIAANKQIDLVTASKLLAKAHGGNIGALKKLFPEISANTVKSKDFAAALDVVAKASGGAAAAAADTLAGRLEGLKLAYGEVLETLGYALLPVLTEFATYIQTNVLPALEAWTNANKDKIASSLKSIFEVLQTVLVKMGEFFGFISRNIETLKVFGAILAGIFVGTKIFAGITALVGAIGLVTTALNIQTAAASRAAIAIGFVTMGASLVLGAAAAVVFYTEMDKVTKSVEGANAALITQAVILDEQGKKSAALAAAAATAGALAAAAANKKAKASAAAAAASAAAAARKAAAAAKQSAATTAATDKKKAESLKAIAKLTKMGAAPTSETDPIQLEAARLNLVKQGILLEQEKFAQFVNARKIETESLKASAEAAMRYSDILTALGDAKITPAEFELLAAKWGITTNAAQLYIQTIVSVRDNVVSSAEVAKLAETWGVTYEQASKYLDFFTAINDGYLSESEIVKLQEKWGFTRKEVTQYSDAFAAADDGKIDLTEIVALGDKWGLTVDEVKKYLAKILGEFGYDPTLFDAPLIAEEGWTAAYGSVEAYKEIAEGVFTVPSTINDASDAASVGWISATADLSSYVAAVAGANSLVIKPPVIPPVIPPELLPVIPPTGGNDNEPRYVPPRGAVVPFAKGGIVTSPTLSLIGEAGPEAVIPLSQMGSMGGGSNITINVGGSVISEGDLVAVIRDQILGLQKSGKSINLSAISI